MNAKPLLLFLMSASTVLAGDPPAEYHASAFPPIPLVSPGWREDLLSQKPESPLVTLGKSDFVITAPLIEGLRPLRNSADLSRGQRFLRLPVIRLFVPQPMPWPPGTGKYFAWRNSDNALPWESRASRPGIVKGPD